MSVLKLTRHAEWYEPKLIPLLGIGYLVIYLNNYDIEIAGVRLLFLILSIAVGAIYVSIINDVCDVKEDAASGKPNRMQNLSTWQTALILVIICTAGVICGCFIYPDKLSLAFYSLSWIVFSLYSIHPIRLKERRIWGVFADASGAHLFPTLFIISNLTYTAGQKVNLVWISIAGVWALFYGLRGILWHQFYDRSNDIAANINTFASRIQPRNFILAERLIFAVEVICFALMSYKAFNVWLLISIVLYIALMLMRWRKVNVYPVIILTPEDRPFSILMHDFYLVFFPFTILLDIAINKPSGWLLICLHILVFPRPVYRISKDFMRLMFFKTIAS